ncbi:hypothetical protein [Nostoc sp.]
MSKSILRNRKERIRVASPRVERIRVASRREGREGRNIQQIAGK